MTSLSSSSLLAATALAAGVGLLAVLGLGGRGEAPAVDRATGTKAARGPLGSGKPVVLAFGGDVHFEGALAAKLAASPSVLSPIAPVLGRPTRRRQPRDRDHRTAAPPRRRPFTFRTPATAFAALRGGGVDVATMANNHGMDFGAAGLRTRSRRPGASGSRSLESAATTGEAYAPFRTVIKGSASR